MKFRCERDALSDALNTAGRAVSSRNTTMPALAGIHLRVEGEHLVATGTDLDVTIRTSLMVNASEEGETVIPARLLTEIVRSLPQGTISIDVEERQAVLSTQHSQFTVRTLDVADYPRVNIPDEYSLSIPCAQLKTVLSQVVRAASHDDARPVLTGVLMSSHNDGLRLVATDSYRLAVADIPEVTVLQSGQSVLIPSRALGELNRVLDGDEPVQMSLGENEVAFRVGETSLTSRLIEGQFPDYQPLLPSNYPNKLTIDRSLLLESLRRVKLLVRDITTPVRITLGDEVSLHVVSQEVGQANEVVDAKYDGESMTVAFNPTYLIDGLESMPQDEVLLETLDALKPATLTPVDASSKFLYLIMPVRVS